MKTKTSYILILFAFLFTAAAFAQVNRSVAPGQYRRTTAKAKVEKGKKIDYIDQTTEFYVTEFTLDDFQAAAVKQVLEAERSNLDMLRYSQDITTDEKREKAVEITTRIDNKIMPMLNPDQLEKYKKFIEKRKQ